MEIRNCFCFPGEVPDESQLALHFQEGEKEEILVFHSCDKVTKYLESVTVANEEDIPAIIALAKKYLPVLNEREVVSFTDKHIDFILLLLKENIRLAEQVEAINRGNFVQIRMATVDDFFPRY